MNKKATGLGFALLLLFAEYVSLGSAHPLNASDPSVLVLDAISEPESFDPAWANDAASHEVIMNVYEPLLFFDRDFTTPLGPYGAGKLNQFVPKLATSWTEENITETSPEGLQWVKRWTFKVRTGVAFHEGGVLTADDVEYSFERLLVQDRLQGPAWMLYEPLLNVSSASPPDVDSSWGLKIDHAVESNFTHVWLNLATEFPSVTFRQILSQPSSGVVNKAWCQARGDLNVESVPSGWNDWAQIYARWNDPQVSPINDRMMGTGPYNLSFWQPGVSWSIRKFDGYWDGWPARASEASADERIGGYITTVIWNYLPFWPSRRARFLVGDSDLTCVDREYRSQVLGAPGVRCLNRWDSPQPPPSGNVPTLDDWWDSGIDNITYKVPLLSISAFFFNFNISTTSPYAAWNALGVFTEGGLPPDIFSDINVRRGFAYAFDYAAWQSAYYLNESITPSDPVIEGLPYDNPNQERYNLNLTTLAPYYLKLAWGGVDANGNGIIDPINEPGDIEGALWVHGMKFIIIYPTGDAAAESAARMLASAINSVYPPPSRFHVDVLSIWSYLFRNQMYEQELPIFITEWRSNYPDPHDLVFNFMHSKGALALSQNYSNATIDRLIERGIATPDGPERQQIYYDLQALYHTDVPSVPFLQPVGREFERCEMRGWYYNPVYHGQYVYHRWKARTHFGDANNDGSVNVVDVAYISSHWTGAMGRVYNIAADINGGVGGTSGIYYGYVPGIPDGTVDITDIGLLSAYFDGPPQGPAHP